MPSCDGARGWACALVVGLALVAGLVAPSLGASVGADVAPAAAVTSVPTVTLHNGRKLPVIGLGCSSGVRKEHIRSALLDGYRHLDTAQAEVWNYFESDLGEALLESGVPRGEVFIQTKIFPEDLGYEATKRVFPKSLERLRTTWVDSLLIHKPRCWEAACKRQPEGTWQDSWRALEDLYDAGVVRAIGICDVDEKLLDELLTKRLKPHIIQNWMDPFHQDERVWERCRAEGIQYQAYSTLGAQWVHFRGHAVNPVLSNPDINAIAEAHNRSSAQVVLNWALARGAAVLPASRDPQRRTGNLASLLFELSEAELAALDALDGALDGTSGARPASVQATFVNVGRGAGPLEAYWVDAGGKEKKVGSLLAGVRWVQQTYAGHTFRFRDQEGLLMEEHVVEEARPVVEVGAADAKHVDL